MISLQRIYFFIIIMAILFPCGSKVEADESERILSYHSYITVHKDRSLTIRETIKVVSTGQQIQRGIYRTFPTRYKDRFNNTVRVGFKVLEVEKNSSPEPYHTEKESNGIKLYIIRKTIISIGGSMECTICKREITDFNPILNEMKLDGSRSAPICSECIDGFLKWQQERFAKLFPTAAAKKRYEKR